MILPEGQKKAAVFDIKYSYIIHNIKKLGFTGRCMTDLNGDESAMVFLDGTCVLAESGNCKGRKAYENLQDLYNMKGDFSLFEYLPGEVVLAEDENPDYVVDFGAAGHEGDVAANLFEDILAELNKEDIVDMRMKIRNEVMDFLDDSDMKHLIKEKK